MVNVFVVVHPLHGKAIRSRYFEMMPSKGGMYIYKASRTMHINASDDVFAPGSALSQTEQFGFHFHVAFECLKSLIHIEDDQYGVGSSHRSIGA
jgi:hypothetical protein